MLVVFVLFVVWFDLGVVCCRCLLLVVCLCDCVLLWLCCAGVFVLLVFMVLCLFWLGSLLFVLVCFMRCVVLCLFCVCCCFVLSGVVGFVCFF